MIMWRGENKTLAALWDSVSMFDVDASTIKIVFKLSIFGRGHQVFEWHGKCFKLLWVFAFLLAIQYEKATQVTAVKE